MSVTLGEKTAANYFFCLCCLDVKICKLFDRFGCQRSTIRLFGYVGFFTIALPPSASILATIFSVLSNMILLTTTVAPF